MKLHIFTVALKLRQGKVFTHLCDSVHGGGSSVQGGLCPGGGVSVQEGGFCLVGGSLSRRGSFSRGSLSRGLCPGNPHTVTCGRYASYWNTLLSIITLIFMYCVR